jgi:hypothetical protein
MYGGNDSVLNTMNTPIQADYVTAMLKGRKGNLVLKGGGAGAATSAATATSNAATATSSAATITPPPASISAILEGTALEGAALEGTALQGTALEGTAFEGTALRTLYDGCRPQHCVPGKWGKGCYEPMQKQGAIILGTGGDNSHHGGGTFFEGCIAAGFASDATDEAIQANIAAAGYGR